MSGLRATAGTSEEGSARSSGGPSSRSSRRRGGLVEARSAHLLPSTWRRGAERPLAAPGPPPEPGLRIAGGSGSSPRCRGDRGVPRAAPRRGHHAGTRAQGRSCGTRAGSGPARPHVVQVHPVPAPPPRAGAFEKVTDAHAPSASITRCASCSRAGAHVGGPLRAPTSRGTAQEALVARPQESSSRERWWTSDHLGDHERVVRPFQALEDP